MSHWCKEIVEEIQSAAPASTASSKYPSSSNLLSQSNIPPYGTPEYAQWYAQWYTQAQMLNTGKTSTDGTSTTTIATAAAPTTQQYYQQYQQYYPGYYQYPTTSSAQVTSLSTPQTINPATASSMAQVSNYYKQPAAGTTDPSKALKASQGVNATTSVAGHAVASPTYASIVANSGSAWQALATKKAKSV